MKNLLKFVKGKNTVTPNRMLVIGDVHGCYSELRLLIDTINPTLSDTLIFLGDLIDRGPDSKAVIDYVMSLSSICNLVVLKGNHEHMMLKTLTCEDSVKREQRASQWLSNGGDTTLSSYMYDPMLLDTAKSTEELYLTTSLKEHLDWLSTLPTYYITDDYIFTHASPKLTESIEEQPEKYLIWRKVSTSDSKLEYKHVSGKTIVCGHTAQFCGLPLILSPHNIVIDTGCYHTGILTAYDLTNQVFIQASKQGIRKARAVLNENELAIT